MAMTDDKQIAGEHIHHTTDTNCQSQTESEKDQLKRFRFEKMFCLFVNILTRRFLLVESMTIEIRLKQRQSWHTSCIGIEKIKMRLMCERT